MKIVVMVVPGVLDSSLAITLDVLAVANGLREYAGQSRLFEVLLAGTGRKRTETGAGLQIGPLALLPTGKFPELVIVPGAFQPTREKVDTWLESRDVARAGAWLCKAVDAGAYLASSCAGTFLLGHAGLLDGRVATTTWWLAKHFKKRFPRVDLDMNRMVVADGPIWTAGAALAQADLMLAVVARWGSFVLANECARFLLLDQRTTQAHYSMPSHLAAQAPTFQRADRWIQAHLSKRITLAYLARALNMTPRTLARHFASAVQMSPIQYVRRLRVERAVHFLETHTESIDSVAARVGYSDSSVLRKLLVRQRGVTPRQLRSRVKGE